MKPVTQKQMLERLYGMFRGTDAYRLLQRLAREPGIRLSAREQSDLEMIRFIEGEIRVPTWDRISPPRVN